MFNTYITKLMVVMAMSFFILSNTFADDSAEKKVETASVREIHKHAVGFGLGQTFLLGNLEKRGDNKITADLLYSYTASYSFDLLVNMHSSHHSYKDKDVYLRGYTMSVKGRYYEFDAFSPFLLGGLGFYLPTIVNDGKHSDEKYTFGFNAGGGIDLRLNEMIIVGLLAQYHKPFEVKQDDMENIRGSYFKLLMTLMYLF
jgi:opacity protein-like surface antigen